MSGSVGPKKDSLWIEGGWLAVETGQELRRAWDDWDSNGTVTKWIGAVMHGSSNVTQVVEWVGNIVQRILVNFSALEEAWKEWRNAPEALKYEAWKLHIREQDYVQDVKELTEESQGLLDKLIDPKM